MGEVFAGRYELIDPIASGGMGTVWRVLDRADGVVKAAKILRQSDAAMLLRFVREQSMRIDHSHVVAPQSWAGVDDRVLFTMPLVRGGSVSDLMRKYGALPPGWIGPLLDQTLQALEAVHAAGIVHRDIKPGNLLLEPTGRGRPHLRLTDFGIAVPSDEPRLTTISTTIGTPGYMPPEAYYGADPDPSADIYAVGMVAYEMLTGQRPPAAADAPPLPLDALRTGDAFHDAVVEVIGVAGNHDPDARPTAAALRAHPALRALQNVTPDPDDPIEIVDVYPDPPAASSPPPPPPPRGATDGYAAGRGTGPALPPPPVRSTPSWPNATTEPQPQPAATSVLHPSGAAGPVGMPTHPPETQPPTAQRGSIVLPIILLLLGLIGLGASLALLMS